LDIDQRTNKKPVTPTIGGLRPAEICLSRETLAAYQALHDVCFVTQRGKGKTAQLRANLAMHRGGRGHNWDSRWNRMFVPEAERATRNEVFKAHTSLIAAISAELGAGDKTPLLLHLAKRLHLSLD
jgi:hypothetical protein